MDKVSINQIIQSKTPSYKSCATTTRDNTILRFAVNLKVLEICNDQHQTSLFQEQYGAAYLALRYIQFRFQTEMLQSKYINEQGEKYTYSVMLEYFVCMYSSLCYHCPNLFFRDLFLQIAVLFHLHSLLNFNIKKGKAIPVTGR
jgi:hypothetical protein